MTNTQPEWEEEFDRRFPPFLENHSAGYLNGVRGDIKSFLKEIVEKAERQGAERAAKEIERGFEIDPKPPGSPMYARGRRDAAAIARTLEAAKKSV